MTNHLNNTPSVNNPASIRVLPELNIAAINQRQDKELAFWYLLRSINVTGCGHVTLQDAEHAFITQFGYSPRTFYRHLNLSKGKVLDCYINSETGRTTIKIYALQTLFRSFGISHASRWVLLSAEQFTQCPRKAILWNTGAYRPFGTGRRNFPISRQSLADVNKVDRRTQQRYDNAAETIKQETTVKAYDPKTHKKFNQKIEVDVAGRPVLITRQAGNIYTSHGTQSHRGMIRRISRMAKAGKESFIVGEAPNKSVMPSKRFYNRFRDAVKAYMAGRNDGTDIYYPSFKNDAVLIQVGI